tara:strand:- start:21059 stop:22366 length:1308 start_codon:yes stop_codon:yes gene_type:complete
MTIIVFILIISFLIFIHELGHLLAAKWANVKVENFSVGFGPKLFKFYIGETEYSLSALPLGGYVKMQGENPTEVSDDSIIDPSRSFSNIPIYKKQIILLAGPLMNLLIPFIFFPIIFLNGIDAPEYLEKKMVLGSINSSDERLEKFKPGMEILSINDVEINTWDDFLKTKNNFLKDKIIFEVISNNKVYEINLDNRFNYLDLKSIFNPILSSTIGAILDNSAAQKNDFKVGDKIISINNSDINVWSDIRKELSNKNIKEFEFILVRNNNLINKKITFDANERNVIGISPEVKTYKKNFKGSEVLTSSFNQSIRSINLIFHGITDIFGKLFTADSGLSDLKKSLAGPIAIAKYSGKAAEKGLNSIIQFIIIISINLGIINLMPIPLLDGGHIFFNTIEALTRRKINPKVQNFFNRIGFLILISLMVFAIYNDIINF